MQALDPEQLALHGTTVVEASAGTGKTYTITSLFLRLLLEQALTVDQILVVTYTRAATAELRDRIRQRLALALTVAREGHGDDAFVVQLCRRVAEREGPLVLQKKLERALAGIDEAPVLTIHGFCQRVLRDHAFESGSAFESQLTAHASPLLEQIADDFFMRELHDADARRVGLLLKEPAKLRELAARVSGRELRLVPEEIAGGTYDHGAWHELLERCRTLWQREREAILELLRAIKGVAGRAKQYAHIVDELLRQGNAKEITGSKSFISFFTRAGVLEKSGGALSPQHDHPFLALSERLHQAALAQIDDETATRQAFRRDFVGYLSNELARRTRETSVRTFDALLGDLDAALSGPSGPLLAQRLRDKYRAALVDEFQDTDPMQYRIFHRIFGEGGAPLLLIGDPKQAIYGFRGADVAAYLSARRHAGERVYTLGVNYRSDGALVDALNALYARVEQPFALADIAYQPVRASERNADRLRASDGRGALDLAVVTLEEPGADAARRATARMCASDIAALLASPTSIRDGANFRTLAARDIAVLCRTNREAALVQEALSERGVPSVLSGDASVFDSEDVPQLERALTALARPGDARALRSFLASIYAGLDGQALLNLEASDQAWQLHRDRMQRLHDVWLSHGFMPALRGLVVAYDVEDRLLQRPDGTRRLTNLWHLAELITEVAIGERLGPLGLLRWLSLVQSDATLRSELVGDAHELRLESNEDAVGLTTVHKSKGLEYPVVYCPFLWADAGVRKSDKEFLRFHDPDHAEVLTLDLGNAASEQQREVAEAESLEEALRLLYVALTRAKHRIVVLLPDVKDLSGSALGYTLFGGGDRAATKARIQGVLDAKTLQHELEAFGFAARPLRFTHSPAYQSRIGKPLTGGARTVKRALDRSFRVASFSALIAKERTSFGEAGIDRDAVTHTDEVESLAAEDVASTLALGDFPRGATAGQLVHEVFEHALFDASREELELLADQLVRQRGYAAELGPSLSAGVWQALHTPLDEHGFSLSHLPKRARIDEMEFVFPVDAQLSARSLERTFRTHKAPSALPSYANDLRDLGFDALRGYLRGFVDLVYRHEGRFYIVDYKSNWLGPRESDYGQPQLARAMAEHHYYLQYHLYAVALHRYLAQRLPDYDYERDFGGVYYLFLRGMSPEHALGTGVFADRPSRALIAALDASLRASEEP